MQDFSLVAIFDITVNLKVRVLRYFQSGSSLKCFRQGSFYLRFYIKCTLSALSTLVARMSSDSLFCY